MVQIKKQFLNNKKAEGSLMTNKLITAIIIAVVILILIFAIIYLNKIDFFKNLPGFGRDRDNTDNPVDRTNQFAPSVAATYGVVQLKYTSGINDDFWFLWDNESKSPKISMEIRDWRGSFGLSGWYSFPNDYGLFKKGTGMTSEEKKAIEEIMKQSDIDNFVKSIVSTSKKQYFESYLLYYANNNFLNEIKQKLLTEEGLKRHLMIKT